MLTNQEAFAAASRVVPGGVSSPARSYRPMGVPTPVFVESGLGPLVTDVEGHSYIDYVGAFGPNILGHAHPRHVAALTEQLGRGLLFGMPSRLETQLAERLVQLVPGLEQLRYVSTGTEAVMSAVRLARGVTGRQRVVKFKGDYHGHADVLLTDMGSAAANAAAQEGRGVPGVVLADVIALPYNDLSALQAVMEAQGEQIAAVIIEPISGNMGLVEAKASFLAGLRASCDRHGSVLIFDEVITAFRFHYGVAAALYGVVPDLYCFGKLLGGGLPLGIFGGRAALMSEVAPLGTIFQAGTHAGNPLSVASGLSCLEILGQPGVYDELERQAASLAAGLLGQAAAADRAVTLNRRGSMFTLYFGPGPVVDFASAQATDKRSFQAFFRALLAEKVLIAPSSLECWFLTLMHDEATIRRTLQATERAFAALG